jgi:hypothetical protein
LKQMNALLKGLLPSFARHIAGAMLGWLVARGWLETDPGSLTVLEEQLVGTITNVVVAMIAVYAVVEKALKPLFFRKLGELLPGEVGPATHDREVVKVEAARVQPEAPTTPNPTDLFRRVHDEPPEGL